MSDEHPEFSSAVYMLSLNKHREHPKVPCSTVTEIAKKDGEVHRAIKAKLKWEQKANKMKAEYNKAVKQYETDGDTDANGENKRKGKDIKPVEGDKEETSEAIKQYKMKI